MTKVVVTGATGFIGSHLVRALIKKGYRVSVFVRKPSQRSDLEKLGAEVFVGSFDQTFLEKKLKGCDFLYHLAAARAASSREEYFRANVLTTKNLLAAAKGKIKRFIYISSAHVHGFPKKLPISEKSPYSPQTFYAESKVAAEKEVRNFSSRLAYTIIRPVLVYGEGDRQQMVFRMAEQFRGPAFFCPGNGQNRMHFIFIDDLVNGLVLMMKKKAENQIFILAGEKPIVVDELLRLIKKRLKINKRIIYLPISLLKPIACLLRPIAFITGREPLITKQRLDIICQDRFYNIGKARKLLGFRPKADYQTGLRRTFGRY